MAAKSKGKDTSQAKIPALKVEKRKLLGRKVKRLRSDGIIPANIYGREVKSQAVQVELQSFQKIFSLAGSTGLVELEIDKEKKRRTVLIHNVQESPLTDLPLHVDFYQVDLKKKVTAQVPVRMIGEAPAVAKGGVLVQIIDEIEVEALPADLPDKFTIDVAGLKEIGMAVTADQLDYDKKKVELKLDDPQSVVVKIEEPTKEEEEKPEVKTVVEGEEGTPTPAEATQGQGKGDAGEKEVADKPEKGEEKKTDTGDKQTKADK